MWATPPAVKHLYEALKNNQESGTLILEEEQLKDFQKLKNSLLHAWALGLPLRDKPFQQYVTERQGLALGY